MSLFLLLLVAVQGDVYMHNPRGANDRNCERNVNRNNGNLLYDTQNNAKGGYACPRAVAGAGAAVPLNGQTPRMKFAEGSLLEVEWTAQHGCGTSLQGDVNVQGTENVKCEIVMQMGCEATLNPPADGTTAASRVYQNTLYPAGTANVINRETIPREGIPTNDGDAATTRINTNDPGEALLDNNNAQRFGVHESPAWYNECNRVQRNRGLFTADQNVNRRSAIGTRQNPNGGRRGLECPEERDYYPYWRPAPFVDMAYLVSDASRCGSPLPTAEYAKLAPCGGWQAPNIGEAGPTITAFQPRGKGEAAGVRGNVALCGLGKESQRLKDDWAGNAQGVAYTNGAAINSNVWHGSCVLTGVAGQANAVPKTNAGLGGGATNDANPTRLFNRREWPNNKADCDKLTASNAAIKWEQVKFSAGFSETGEGANIAKVAALGAECRILDESRSNHLGNDGSADTASRYTLTMPSVVPAGAASEACFLRIRYNMSSSDYLRNLSSALNGNASPIQQDPLVTIGAGDADPVQLALNTNQVARTFQDRSYVFYITKQTGVANGQVELNVNVRGKRGNIVQTYPSVEYDLIPKQVIASANTVLTMQWTGSDYNPRRGCNDGEGGPACNNDANCHAALQRNANQRGTNQNSRTDRMSLLETTGIQKNYPANLGANNNAYPTATGTSEKLFASRDSARIFAFANAEAQLKALNPNLNCLTKAQIEAINNENQRENHPRNCAEANALSPYFAPQKIDLAQKKPNTRLKAYSARNNNFSNRDTKFTVLVTNVAVTPTVPLTPVVSEMVSTSVPPAFVPLTESELNSASNKDVPGFDPIENDDYGEGALEGCTQQMMIYGSAPTSFSVFYLLVCSIFLVYRFN